MANRRDVVPEDCFERALKNQNQPIDLLSVSDLCLGPDPQINKLIAKLSDQELQTLFNGLLKAGSIEQLSRARGSGASQGGMQQVGPDELISSGKTKPITDTSTTNKDRQSAVARGRLESQVSAPTKRLSTGKYLPESINAKELQDLRPFGRDANELLAIKKEINAYGRNPEEMLVEAMKGNRVLAIGEHHVDSSHRQLGAKMMPKLKQAGATHLALEVPAELQPALDAFMLTGSKDKLQGALRQYQAILGAAREAGLKVVAVDKRGEAYRDNHMAAKISGILDSDPKNKVIFWVGAAHLECNNPHDKQPTAAALLKRKYSVCTIRALNEMVAGTPDSLESLTGELTKPVAISMRQASKISTLTDVVDPEYPFLVKRYGYWDQLIIYPRKGR